MDLIQKRIKYEADPLAFSSDDVPFDFFPRATSISNCGKYETRKLGDCKTGLDDWTKGFIANFPPNQSIAATQANIEDNMVNNSIGG